MDGASVYRGYFVPNGGDPFGEEVAGWHHPYPCHLGGRYNQPLVFLTKEAHTAAHGYFRDEGFRYGAAGRELWKALGPSERIAHIKKSLEAAGVSKTFILSHIDDILKGANAGILTPRIGPKGTRIFGKVAGVAFGAGIALDILSSPSTCYAAEPNDFQMALDRFWNNCEDKQSTCECTENFYVFAEPRWWNFTYTNQGKSIQENIVRLKHQLRPLKGLRNGC